MTKENQVKPADKNTTQSAKNASPKKITKDKVPTKVVVLSRSVFTNGQYCAAIRVERSAA